MLTEIKRASPISSFDNPLEISCRVSSSRSVRDSISLEESRVDHGVDESPGSDVSNEPDLSIVASLKALSNWEI